MTEATEARLEQIIALAKKDDTWGAVAIIDLARRALADERAHTLEELEEPNPARAIAQAREISILLGEAGLGPCPLAEGVRRLIAQRDSATGG